MSKTQEIEVVGSFCPIGLWSISVIIIIIIIIIIILMTNCIDTKCIMISLIINMCEEKS